MSFEDTPAQSEHNEVAAPVKKRGRPAGAKNKKPVANKATVNPLASKLHHAELYISNLEEEHKKLRRAYKTEVDGLMAIISYLESTLKEAWKDDSSV
jgi:hypothetical protein